MRDLFLLDPEVVFLNHGSYGACPVEVFEVYQQWQRELERQPVAFLGRRSAGLLAEARQALADYLNAVPDDLVYIHNATTGVNIIARSLAKVLQPGDEILSNDHEYGACENAWKFVCQATGARLVRTHLPLPLGSPDEVADLLWSGVTERTKVLFLSHITSPTGLILPVEALCARAREAGILTVIDGAHAPGQIPLNLEAIGADFYTGNCHKWLCAPKGAAFLHVRPEHHDLIDGLVISWGYTEDMPPFNTMPPLIRKQQYQGTDDIAAYLSVPAAIEFQKKHNWDSIRESCHLLAIETQTRLSNLTGLPKIADPSQFAQMTAALLPDCDGWTLKARLYDAYRIEIPVTYWNGRHLVRASLQGYNTQSDADALLNALAELLPQLQQSHD